MRYLLVVLLVLGVTGSAMASITDSRPDAVRDPGTPYLNPDPPIREAGDTIGDPFILEGLGTVTGTTAGFTDNYDEICPYGSSSPEVVYAFAPATNMLVNIDLCYSSYDTKVYVYADSHTQGNPFACNDDYWFQTPCYPYSSLIGRMPVQAGHTYYIVVDGYGGQFGDYSMEVTEAEPPQPVECPPGALIEGEPPCVDGYVDEFNSGCGGNPTVWSPIYPQTGDCAVMCAKSCTFVSSEGYLRDTDWFESIGAGGLVTATCTAEFPLQFMIIYGTDCAAIEYVLGHGDPGEPVTLSWTVGEGVAVWLWVGNQTFTGWPESDYVLDVCGIQDPPPPPGACCSVTGACIVVTPEVCAFTGGVFYGGACTPTTCEPVPTNTQSWGAIKKRYR